MIAACALLTLVTAERLAELVIARRNTQRLRALGAQEFAPAHYPLIVALHALWLLGLWIFGYDHPIQLAWLAVFIILQGLRAWVLISIGRRWTTRVMVLPGETLVARGPYRFVKHPNYIVVIGEIAVLPLCLGMPLYALLFSILNAAVLSIRIRAENNALAKVRKPALV